MEPLQRLSRRQVDTLGAVGECEALASGAPLKSIARRLRVSSPSALEHLTTLEELRLVVRYRGKSRLTARGEACLQEYRRHHRVAESLFQRVGLGPQETCDAARQIDLALSHETIDRLCGAEGHPRVCPHGAPIDPCATTGRGT